MRAVATGLGVVWMGVIVAAGLWLGLRETFFDEPGILFAGGYGDIYILAIVGIPGYLLYRWGTRV